MRRHLLSIMKNSSPKIVIEEAKRRGWLITAYGNHWLFYADTLSHRQVLSRSTASTSRKRRRRPAKRKRGRLPCPAAPRHSHPF